MVFENNNVFYHGCEDCDGEGCNKCKVKEVRPLPKNWENAPLSAQIAYMIAGDDAEEFDRIKDHLKGE